MYDPTMLTVAQAMYADRLARAEMVWRLPEARTARQAVPLRGIAPLRGGIARMLLALAGQIAPPAHTVHQSDR